MGKSQRYLGGRIGQSIPSSGVTSTSSQPAVYDLSGQYYIKKGGGWTHPFVGTGNIEATGGTTATYSTPTGSYKSHTFTSSGSFQVTGAPAGGDYDAEFWLQGAGGGTKNNPMGPPGPGGGNREAGSGAGGALYGPAGDLPVGTYPVTIGGGGSESNGSNSVFATPSPGPGPHTALGGGAGGAGDPSPPCFGGDGGCGGGGWYISGNPNKGEGAQPSPHPTVTGLGYDGSDGKSAPEYGGAGGGTAGAGGYGTANGAGTPNVYRYGPTNAQTYGVGGESSDYANTNRQAAGGANTGNGSSAHATGGSGVLVIRYKTSG